MSQISQFTELVEKMVRLHESGDFSELNKLMSKSVLENSESWFSPSRFEEVCEKIARNLGKLETIEYIDSLTKSRSIQTLWKAIYSKTSEEILWQMEVERDAEFPKIIKMSVN